MLHRSSLFTLGTIFGAVFFSAIAFAWTGPTSAPPNGNISPPINVGTTDQVKNAGLSVNSLAVFGNSALTGTLTVGGNVTALGFFHSSDARLKEQVATLPGLSIVEKLRGVSFIWKKDGTRSAGVIAQEVEAVMPSAVHTDDSGMKSVDYDQLVGTLIEAVKELDGRNEIQHAQITSLMHEMEILKASH